MAKNGFTTQALNVSYPKNDPYNAMQMPIYESVSYEFDSAEQIAANFRGEYPAHAYSRSSNPSVEYFEKKLNALCNGQGAIALSSGMAAISNTLLAITRQGDNIIASNRTFGHTAALFRQTLPEFGIESRLSDLQSAAAIEALIDSKTRAIFFETVSNPQLEIADIEMLASVAQKHGILLIADTTLTPPNVFCAGAFGINIEVISTTKHISGGATSFGGAIVNHGNYDWSCNPNTAPYVEKFGTNALVAKIKKNIFRNTGGSMSPQTARFQSQGLDILELRVERCYQNCMALGKFMQANASISQVSYPGLPEDSSFTRAQKYFGGTPGTIMSFDLDSKEACFTFMNRLQLIRRATNLNDNKTLIIHPASTIYCEFSEDERAKANIRATMMRLSVGIENVQDLIADIEQALGH